MVNVRIFVTYKQSVFNPQGETITDAIHSLGFSAVKKVNVGKFFDLQIEPNGKSVEEIVSQVSEQLLVNFNLETYHYEVMEEA
ncbi:phosphoribosylformylglycinamidine synthase subunit PurS [Liquorilactobacillus mali]|uniref:Phosphoribosylformylglycinamidine synthase subunit PurS n=1 Tax=Liquorilactobacillus mali TaxID=1618 RepID=A0A0R2G3Q8_9LACO|nr:phosphoribosylformylglycinamidine synthase subunit PurS [Liquorilactobacillus mali]KRN31549.1 phosphoribosylformylglycinamidine synthase [Liquorilactobacillus mali]MDN7145238.1 phosphoribosylformylglycinamidine synthase subunit PurS [Liquorilactobacillus mali]